MTPPKPFVTKSGRVLSDADIYAIADEVVGDIDVETLKPRRRGALRCLADPRMWCRFDSTLPFAPQ